MNTEQIKQEDNLREMIELSIHNALIAAAKADYDPLVYLWRTALGADIAVGTCKEKLLTALVSAYLR